MTQQLAPVSLVPALIVEDVPATRDFLAGLLHELHGVDADIMLASTLAEAHDVLASVPRAFALVDVGLPDGNGTDLIAWLHEHRPDMAVAVISGWHNEDTIMEALRAGADGYLFKERDADELRAALETLQRGGAPIDPFVARRILDQLADPPNVTRQKAPEPVNGGLTPRETQILQLVDRGCTNREIAEAIDLSLYTIEGYTKAIYRKLAVRSRTSAVFEARNRGLIG